MLLASPSYSSSREERRKSNMMKNRENYRSLFAIETWKRVRSRSFSTFRFGYICMEKEWLRGCTTRTLFAKNWRTTTLPNKYFEFDVRIGCSVAFIATPPRAPSMFRTAQLHWELVQLQQVTRNIYPRKATRPVISLNMVVLSSNVSATGCYLTLVPNSST